MINAILIEPADNMITVTQAAKAGDEITYVLDGRTMRIQAVTDIPIYHKTVVKDIQKGDKMIKYGHFVGYALQDIKKGEWAHCHNVDSKLP